MKNSFSVTWEISKEGTHYFRITNKTGIVAEDVAVLADLEHDDNLQGARYIYNETHNGGSSSPKIS